MTEASCTWDNPGNCSYFHLAATDLWEWGRKKMRRWLCDQWRIFVLAKSGPFPLSVDFTPWAIAVLLFWLSDTSSSWCLVGYPISKLRSVFGNKPKECKLVGLAFGLPEYPRFSTGICASVDPGNMKPTDKMKNRQVGGPTPWIRKTYSKSNTSSKSDFVSWDQ